MEEDRCTMRRKQNQNDEKFVSSMEFEITYCTTATFYWYLNVLERDIIIEKES